MTEALLEDASIALADRTQRTLRRRAAQVRLLTGFIVLVGFFVGSLLSQSVLGTNFPATAVGVVVGLVAEVLLAPRRHDISLKRESLRAPSPRP